MSAPIYYFGCWDQAGHYLHEPGGRTISRETIGPFDAWGHRGMPLDGRWTPGPHESHDRGYVQDESFICLTHAQGWTVLSMWDRSVDTRGGCNANFIAEGLKTMDEMWALARQHYPQIVARLKAAPRAAGAETKGVTP